MSRRMSQRRALRRIERDLASDPRLNAFFMALNGLGRGKEMPGTEQIPAGPHRLGRRTRHRAGEDGRAWPRTIR